MPSFVRFNSTMIFVEEKFGVQLLSHDSPAGESSEPQPPFFNLTRFGEQPYLLNTGNANYAVEVS